MLAEFTFNDVPQILQVLNNKVTGFSDQLQTIISEISNKDKPEAFVNVKGAADILGVKTSTVYGYTHRNEIPFYKVNAILLFKPSELITFIESHRVKTTYELAQQATVMLSTRKKI